MTSDFERILQGEKEMLKNYFDWHPRYDFVRAVGNGIFGVGVLVNEKHRKTNRVKRRLVVKRAIQIEGMDNDEELEREARTLLLFRGACHIVQMVDYRLNPRRNPQSKTVLERLREMAEDIAGMPKAPIWKTIGEGLGGPTIVMEYIEYGNVARLVSRLVETGRILPNRVLWSFFLCLVKACVALAYPPQGGRFSQPRVESIPVGAQRPSTIIHNDLHQGNVMIGNGDSVPAGFEDEHKVPYLKMIDFGEAMNEVDDPENPLNGVHRNIFDVGVIMMCLMVNIFKKIRPPLVGVMTRYYVPDPRYPQNGVETLAVDLLPRPDVNKTRHAIMAARDDLLTRTVVYCLALDPSQRPALQDLLDVTTRAVRERNAWYYHSQPYADNETDETVSSIVQDLIMDADVGARNMQPEGPEPMDIDMEDLEASESDDDEYWEDEEKQEDVKMDLDGDSNDGVSTATRKGEERFVVLKGVGQDMGTEFMLI